MDKNAILTSVKECLKQLLKSDYYLLDDLSYAKEETLNHRLAFYLENSGCFNSYNVDIEYIAVAGEQKNIITSDGNLTRNIRPDIIIHKRGSDLNNNLVVFEAKKEYLRKKDKEKLEKLTNGNSNAKKYLFGVGLSYQLGNINKYFLIRLYQNGSLTEEIKIMYSDILPT